MANLHAIRKEKILLDLDKERELKFTLSAFADMEDRYGNVEKAMEAIKTEGMRGIRFLLYLGLRHEDKELTEQSVGELIDIRDIGLLTDAIGKCFGSEDIKDGAIVAANPN